MTHPLALLLLAPALAAELPFAGERLVWEVSYAGVAAGTAWAEARAEEGALLIDAGCRNAAWYEAIYVVDDAVRSTWVPERGSSRYETRFREGRFHQDQDMRLGPEGVEVWRRQLRDGAWEERTTRHAAAPGAEDPVSAMYALRLAEGDGPWDLRVWSGKKLLHVTAVAGPAETVETPLGAFVARRVSLSVPHEGEVQQKGSFAVWLTEDPRRLPVRAELEATVGTFRADLVEARAPGSRPASTEQTRER